MVSVVCRLSPWRSKRGSGATARCTNSEPLGPPRWPAAPRSASRSVEPSSTPAGTSTVNVLSSMRRPSPRQSAQGSGIISPVPPQREQATLVTTCPSSDWRTRRSSPVPWQSTQVTGLGARSGAPAGAGRARGREPDRDLLAAAEDGLGELEPEPHLGVGPGLGPPAAAAAAPAIWPKKASKMSPSPPSNPKPPMPPACAPKTPSGAVAVVAGPALGVAQDLVGDGHLLEARLGLGVALVGVGVQLAGARPVGALDLLVAGVGPDARAARRGRPARQ